MYRWIIATCVLATMAVTADAQPPGRGSFSRFFAGRGHWLIDLEEVRKELRVTDQQATLLDLLQEDLNEQRLAIREQDEGPRSADDRERQRQLEALLNRLTEFDRQSESLIAVVVEPEQATRLSELFFQRDGVRAFERPEVAKKLQLTDEQKERLKSLRETFVENRPRGSTSQQRQEQREKEQAALRELLNDEQRTVWEKLIGEPFNFPQRSRRGPRGR